MALNKREILEELKNKKIVIHPFDINKVQPNSVDVTLGEFYYRIKKPESTGEVYNIWSKNDTDRLWVLEKAEKSEVKLDGISEDDLVIWLAPGETILAHTREFIGGREDITTMMKARSSIIRSFVSVCRCGGSGDVGYFSRWCMEIGNNSTEYKIPLVVGRRIAQIVFFRTGTGSSDYSIKGKYQNETSLEELIASWKPEMLLPKLYKDYENELKRKLNKH